jgi:DNA damage-binding protein 1
MTEQRSDQARSAYLGLNVEESKKAHLLKAVSHTEETNEEGKYLKTIVFGGLDGISTIFAFLAGAVGADLALVHIIAIGCAQLFAGALGMGLGEYLSSKAEQAVASREQAREHWEVENNPEGEISEMVDIYVSKGMTQEDGLLVAQTLSKYKEFWVEHMMLHEIGMFPPDEDDSWATVLQGFVMFLSFIVLGGLPLVAYVIAGSEFTTPMDRFAVTCLASCGALMFLGMLKAKMAGGYMCKEGVAMMVNGLLCAGGAYVIGDQLPRWLHLES